MFAILLLSERYLLDFRWLSDFSLFELSFSNSLNGSVHVTRTSLENKMEYKINNDIRYRILSRSFLFRLFFKFHMNIEHKIGKWLQMIAQPMNKTNSN